MGVIEQFVRTLSSPGPPGVGRAGAWRPQPHARELRDVGNLGAGYVPAAPVLSGTFVTPETALGVAAIYSAVNVIATDYASLPCALFEMRGDGGLNLVRGGDLGDLQDILTNEPNEEMDSFRWRQTYMEHALTRGNGLNECVRDKKGFTREIWPLHPAKTLIKRTEVPAGSTARGQLYYELENKKVLAAENCLHFAGMGFNGVQGFCPITVCRQTIGVSMGGDQYAAAFYGNHAKPSGWIKMIKRLSEPAMQNWRKTFNQVHQGSQSAHQIGFLEEGMDWVQANFSPVDSQLILSRAFQVKDVARIWRIPPHKIGDYSESHISSVEEANLDYQTTTLYGWVCMGEAAMNRVLLTRDQRKRYVIRIDMSALLRGNVEARMKRIETMHSTGAWCADDILLSEGCNPIGPAKGGDKHLVQMQYIPLENAGKAPPPAKPESKSLFPGLADRMNGHAELVNAG